MPDRFLKYKKCFYIETDLKKMKKTGWFLIFLGRIFPIFFFSSLFCFYRKQESTKRNQIPSIGSSVFPKGLIFFYRKQSGSFRKTHRNGEPDNDQSVKRIAALFTDKPYALYILLQTFSLLYQNQQSKSALNVFSLLAASRQSDRTALDSSPKAAYPRNNLPLNWAAARLPRPSA